MSTFPALAFYTFKPGLFLLPGSSVWAAHAVCSVSYNCPFSLGGRSFLSCCISHIMGFVVLSATAEGAGRYWMPLRNTRGYLATNLCAFLGSVLYMVHFSPSPKPVNVPLIQLSNILASIGLKLKDSEQAWFFFSLFYLLLDPMSRLSFPRKSQVPSPRTLSSC